MSKRSSCIAAFFLLLITATSARALADDKLTFAVPGQPPVFSGLIAFVAADVGLFKKYGLDATVRKFDSGVAAAQAVATGQIEASISPTGAIVNMVSNAGVPVVGIWGMEHPDWLLGSLDPQKSKCGDVKGQAVGVDTIGGARAVALAGLIRPCGLKLDDVKLVSLGSNVGAAMVAGQIDSGVLHIDDVPVIEREAGRHLIILETDKQANPLTHYNLLVVRKDKLQAHRDMYIRLVAALMDTVRYMNDPKNLDRVAQIATVTGRSLADAKAAVPRFLKLEFWPKSSDGLTQRNIEAMISQQAKVGGIKPGKKPVADETLVDRTVYKDALKLVK